MFWAGDHAAEGKLKDLITGEHHFIEYKGKEPIWVRNYVRLFVTGNPDWLVPAGFEERRFAALDMGEARMQDTKYFAAIDAEMDNGGREALLEHLLRFDLSTVNLREIPKTAALLEQKMSSLSPEQGWWLDTLVRGELPWGVDEPDQCRAASNPRRGTPVAPLAAPIKPFYRARFRRHDSAQPDRRQWLCPSFTTRTGLLSEMGSSPATARPPLTLAEQHLVSLSLGVIGDILAHHAPERVVKAHVKLTALLKSCRRTNGACLDVGIRHARHRARANGSQRTSCMS